MYFKVCEISNSALKYIGWFRATAISVSSKGLGLLKAQHNRSRRQARYIIAVAQQ